MGGPINGSKRSKRPRGSWARRGSSWCVAQESERRAAAGPRHYGRGCSTDSPPPPKKGRAGEVREPRTTPSCRWALPRAWWDTFRPPSGLEAGPRAVPAAHVGGDWLAHEQVHGPFDAVRPGGRSWRCGPTCRFPWSGRPGPVGTSEQSRPLVAPLCQQRTSCLISDEVVRKSNSAVFFSETI